MTDPTNNSYQAIAEFVNQLVEIYNDEENDNPIPQANQLIEAFCKEYGLSTGICEYITSNIELIYNSNGEVLEEDVLLSLEEALPKNTNCTQEQRQGVSDALFKKSLIDSDSDYFNSEDQWNDILSSLHTLGTQMEGYIHGGKVLGTRTAFSDNVSEITFQQLNSRQKYVHNFISELEKSQNNPEAISSIIDAFKNRTGLGRNFADHMKTSITSALMASDGEPLTRADIIHCMGLAAEHIKNKRISPEAIAEAATLLEYEDGLEGAPNDLGRTKLQAPMSTLVDKMKI